MPAMARRFSEALLLALLLLAVQTAVLTHEHEGSAGPAGAAAQSCEFCVGHHAAAPAPEAAVAAHPEFHPLLLPAPASAFVLAGRPGSAHRSRAPPVFRST
jgi:hypothetical protein